MADPRPAPLSFRPPARTTRDEEFDERLFDQVALPPGSDGHESPDGAADTDEEPAPAREGLPAGFRMRADAHYVDQVVSRRLAEPILLIPVADIDAPPAAGDLEPLVRSVARFGILQPLLVRRSGGRYALISGVRRLAAAAAAGLSEVPCLVYFADDAKALALAEAANLSSQEQALPAPADPLPAGAFGELTEQLGAIDACLHLFAERERPTRERVGMALIRMEVRRAAWLAQALGVLSAEPPVMGRPLDLAATVRRLASTLAPEQSVTGVAIEAVALERGLVRGDEQLVAIALAGTVEAVLAAAERCPGSRVVLTVRQKDEAVLVEASLAGGDLPCRQRVAFLDLESADRPGGARAAIGVKAAGCIAALHGGTLTATEQGGAPRLVLALPSAASI